MIVRDMYLKVRADSVPHAADFQRDGRSSKPQGAI